MTPTPEQAEKIKKILTERWAHSACEVCHATEWKTNGVFYKLCQVWPEHPESDLPVIVVHCNRCGNWKVVGAIAWGLIDPKTDKLP